MRLTEKTIRYALSYAKWQTAGQVCDYLRQCGPMCFADDAEYEDFKFSIKRDQYQAVYRALMRLRKSGVDCVLGDDRGREVRVFMLVEPANPVR